MEIGRGSGAVNLTTIPHATKLTFTTQYSSTIDHQ